MLAGFAGHGYAEAIAEAAKQTQHRLGINELLLPIDHLATRIYSQNREAAILEYLTLSSYYYWGSYDITDQNSSTNVTKSVHYQNELDCPAKVFTAANHPYFMNRLLTESPTVAFVRNFGPRLHHIAVAVKDGETAALTNIDFVVQSLRDCGQKILLNVIELQGRRTQANLLQRIRVFIAYHRICSAFRRLSWVFYQGQRGRTDSRYRGGRKPEGAAG
jgi:hypothetical protein